MKIKEVISKDLRLPFSFIKGNVKARDKKAQKMYELFHSELNKNSKGKICTVDNIKKAIENTLFPFKVNYDIVENQNNKDVVASFGVKCGAEYLKDSALIMVKKYQFAFRINQKNEIPAKYSILHETSHFIDKLFNPKMILFRIPKKTTQENNDVLDIRDTLYGILLRDLDSKISKKEIKSTIERLLDRIPLEERANILQSFRYAIMSEIKAYNNEISAILKDELSFSNIKTAIKLKVFLAQNCKFDYKLKQMNKYLKETIQKERTLNQKRNY